MRIARLSGVVAGAMVLLMAVLLAQESARPAEETVEPQKEVRRIILKRYTDLTPEFVWQAADAGARADVRFSDSFERGGTAGGALRSVRLGAGLYRIAVVFGTQSQLTCLVPVDQQDTRGKVGTLRRGQEITVEGTVVGMIGTNRCVLVDRVMTGHDEKSEIKHELILRWPGVAGAAPKMVGEMGDFMIQFPCRYKDGEVETVTVLVEQYSRAWFLEQLEKAKAQERGEEGKEGQKEPPEKRYDTYRPEGVYRHAVDGHVLDVRFEDRFKGRTPGVPPVLRLPSGLPMRVGYVFDTYTGLSCIVRAQDRPILELADRLLPGQEVEVKGTILPPTGAYKFVVVDELGLPGVKGPTENPDVWVVRVFLGDQKPRMFYEVGRYALDFPCRFVEGRTERLETELREIRVIRGVREGEEERTERLTPKKKPEQPATP